MTLDQLIEKLQALQPEHGKLEVWVGEERCPWDLGQAGNPYVVPARPPAPGDSAGFPSFIAITHD